LSVASKWLHEDKFYVANTISAVVLRGLWLTNNDFVFNKQDWSDVKLILRRILKLSLEWKVIFRWLTRVVVLHGVGIYCTLSDKCMGSPALEFSIEKNHPAPGCVPAYSNLHTRRNPQPKISGPEISIKKPSPPPSRSMHDGAAVDGRAHRGDPPPVPT
jgi:hypothetical protein